MTLATDVCVEKHRKRKYNGRWAHTCARSARVLSLRLTLLRLGQTVVSRLWRWGRGTFTPKPLMGGGAQTIAGDRGMKKQSIRPSRPPLSNSTPPAGRSKLAMIVHPPTRKTKAVGFPIFREEIHPRPRDVSLASVQVYLF